MSKRDVVITAVNRLRNSEFKATAIKIELEAQLGRNTGRDCNGEHECSDCNGNYDNTEQRCNECDGLDHTDEDGNCPDEYYCENCNGSGITSYCQYCDEGYVECGEYCNGDEWTDDRCEQYILKDLEQFGLSEKINNTYKIKKPLVFQKFYVDGSVDSEFTCTILLSKKTNIFYLPKIVKAFNKLANEIGNGVNINKAGMHMALISDKNGKYQVGNYPTIKETKKYDNFRKSMTLLLPALYCLGASNDESRGLDYRRPEISQNSHRAAIDFRNRALEFRIFDTCYDKPDNILDNVVVMSKCIRYWTEKYIPSGMEKITSEIMFGNALNNKLDRFYVRCEHIDLLNAGLRKLKPDYYTIGDIKKQRKLSVNKHQIKSKLSKCRKDAEGTYQDYIKKFDWSLLAEKYKQISYQMPMEAPDTPIEMIEEKIKPYIEKKAKTKKALDQHIEEEINKVAPAGTFKLVGDKPAATVPEAGHWTISIDQGLI